MKKTKTFNCIFKFNERKRQVLFFYEDKESTGPAPVGASSRQCNLLWRLVACSGSNCLPTGSWWPVTAQKLNLAARKFQNFWNFRRATCIEQSARSVHQVAPNGANNPPIGIHWNVMARAKLRQWDFAPRGATWRHYAPNNSNRGG